MLGNAKEPWKLPPFFPAMLDRSHLVIQTSATWKSCDNIFMGAVRLPFRWASDVSRGLPSLYDLDLHIARLLSPSASCAQPQLRSGRRTRAHAHLISAVALAQTRFSPPAIPSLPHSTVVRGADRNHSLTHP